MKRVLLIEPNTVLAKVYTRMLEQKGYQARHVTTAQAGIDAADSARPDVVVLELQIAKHSGIEFLHEFRSYPEWLNIPVIVNTVITPNRIADVQQALQRDLGVTTILYKPKTSLEALVQAVQQQVVAT